MRVCQELPCGSSTGELQTHPPLALPLCQPTTVQELRDVLRAIPYNDNDVWLHTDESLMPRARKTWASWNFLGRSADKGGDK